MATSKTHGDVIFSYKTKVVFSSLKTLFCSFWHVFSLFTHFSWNFGQVVLFLVSRNWLVTLANSLEAVLHSNRFRSFLWQSLLLGTNYLSVAFLVTGKILKNSISFQRKQEKFFIIQVLFVLVRLIKQRIWMIPNFKGKLTTLVSELEKPWPIAEMYKL